MARSMGGALMAWPQLERAPLDQCYDRVLNYNITTLLFIHIYIATMPHIMGSVYI